MNGIFLTFLLVAGFGAIRTWRSMQGGNEITRRTTVPGYSRTPGSEFAIDSDGLFRRGTDWTVDTIEEFHVRGRNRLVLTITTSSAMSVDDVEDLCRELTRKVIAKTRAHVVFADVESADHGRLGFILAPDGHGWGGEAVPQQVFAVAR